MLSTRWRRGQIEPSNGGAAIELLPSIADLDHLPDFDTIIKLPEETDVNAETFKPAFEQLPALVQEQRADIDFSSIHYAVLDS
ncbi:hypothetical protein PAXINDRAFT_14497 [Paxillus involutus ATCC 200175]|uniref:Uncharacterized protein n=1 Tax=Paxillus involutus ATCC 200175 TaxID=664439 RepID=A0A0C9SUI5_PAXIN|nr:hypothetical protein PAXINDRAFT_14497 [Paxillus involutus ATCC 200175]